MKTNVGIKIILTTPLLISLMKTFYKYFPESILPAEELNFIEAYAIRIITV
jgi:hypothetical protein